MCIFVNDECNETVIKTLKEHGVKAILLRCAGFNNVNLDAAEAAGLAVLRVPAYSPNAVAEFAAGLLMTLNRKIHKAYNRVRDSNFLLDGLLGFDLNGRTAGIIGTGRIGLILARILRGFGMRVIAYDIYKNEKEMKEIGATYVDSLEELYKQADVISLHSPLLPTTYHMIDAKALALMKRGVVLINTSRGGLVDTRALIDALKSGHLGGLAMDVYEEEQDLFFSDLSDKGVNDDVFARLVSFPNVIISGHQAFFTTNAVTTIAEVTLKNAVAVLDRKLHHHANAVVSETHGKKAAEAKHNWSVLKKTVLAANAFHGHSPLSSGVGLAAAAPVAPEENKQ